MKKYKMKCFKLKATKYCILNQSLYWKDPRGLLLNCVDKYDCHKIMSKMHKDVLKVKITRKTQLTKFLEKGINGLLYFVRFSQWLELVWNDKYLQGSIN